MSKNREDAPMPSSNSRVKLQVVMEDLGSDYINARSECKSVNYDCDPCLIIAPTVSLDHQAIQSLM